MYRYISATKIKKGKDMNIKYSKAEDILPNNLNQKAVYS